LFKPLPFPRAGRIFDLFDVPVVLLNAAFDHAAFFQDDTVEIQNFRFQPRAVLADGPADPAFAAQHDVVPDGDAGQNFRPQAGHPVVHDGKIENFRLKHFHQVFVFQRIRDEDDVDGFPVFPDQPIVQKGQAFIIAGGFAHMHGLSGQIINGAHGGRRRTRDQDFRHAGQVRRRGKVHRLQALLRHRDVAGGNIAEPSCHIAKEEVPRPWNNHDGQRAFF